MKHTRVIVLLGILLVSLLSLIFLHNHFAPDKQFLEETESQYWFLLHRKSNKEEFFNGVPGEREKSILLKTFQVKTGIPGERPTPLPHLVGRDYWIITEKHAEFDNPETAPYFITLDVPAPSEAPFGPVPYTECNGQCDWVRPGDFGLHGTNGKTTRLSVEDPGSSGCIRHIDKDITYLYNLLDPTKQEIRYYIEDN